MEDFRKLPLAERVKKCLLGQNDLVFRNEWSFLPTIRTTQEGLLATLSLRVNAREREVQPLLKGLYCTFSHTGGYSPYNKFLRTRRFSKFQSISACTVEQFLSYKGRQVPNSEVLFFETAQEAINKVG